jgi:hypothetical protein
MPCIIDAAGLKRQGWGFGLPGKCERKPLTFTVPVEGPKQTVMFVPFFRVAHGRYSVYWKLMPKVQPDA